MGFSKDRAVTTFNISLIFQLPVDDGLGTMKDEMVTHTLRLATIAEREAHRRNLLKVRGRKVRAEMLSANFELWLQIVERVEGYDDIPADKCTDKVFLKEYFSDSIGRLHVEEVMNRYDDLTSAEDADFEKKFVL